MSPKLPQQIGIVIRERVVGTCTTWNRNFCFLLIVCLLSLPLPFSLPSLLLSLSFLIAKDAAGRPVGFVNFRFDLDESIEVVYWYVKLLDIYMRVLLFFVHLPKCVGGEKE